jgi:NADH:ubiquinone oxidoreductase subunit C
MISDRKRGGDQSWTTRAREAVDNLRAARSKKSNAREVLRKLKDHNYASLADCTSLDLLQALVRESRVPKSTEATELMSQLDVFVKEGEALQAKAIQSREEDPSDAKNRDIMAEAAKIKVD